MDKLKSGLNSSYLRSHFSRLPQAVAKEVIYSFSHKVSYDYKIFDPFINGFSTNGVRSRLHIYDHPIVNFVIRGLYLGFSNNYHVGSLDRFRKPVVDKVKTDVCI